MEKKSYLKPESTNFELQTVSMLAASKVADLITCDDTIADGVIEATFKITDGTNNVDGDGGDVSINALKCYLKSGGRVVVAKTDNLYPSEGETVLSRNNCYEISYDGCWRFTAADCPSGLDVLNLKNLSGYDNTITSMDQCN